MKTRMTATRKVWAAGAAVGVVVLAGAVHSPANAAPNQWMLGYTDGTFAAPGDELYGLTMDLSFTGEWLPVGQATVDCNNVNVSGFTYTVPASPPGGASNTWIEIDLTPPSTPVTGCTNSVDSGPVTVSFAAGEDWKLRIKTPTSNGSFNGQAYTGTLQGEIIVPTGSSGNGTVTAVASTLPSDVTGQPCTIQAPAINDMTVPGFYNPTYDLVKPSGLAYDDGSQPDFDINNDDASPANCSNVRDWAVLQDASVELQAEIAATSAKKIPTAVWEQ